jgi:hypothetical protein
MQIIYCDLAEYEIMSRKKQMHTILERVNGNRELMSIETQRYTFMGMLQRYGYQLGIALRMQN